jgi:hypothetical protein
MPAYLEEWTSKAGKDNFAADPPNAALSVYEPGTSNNTLGETSTVLPEKFRAIGPMIAISGLFTFGWTGSSLV